MPQAVADPDELRNFARSLKKFNHDLRERSQSIGNQLNSLGASWRDQEHKKFVEQFEQHMKMLGKFLETSDQHIPYLLRKADHLEDYLQS